MAQIVEIQLTKTDVPRYFTQFVAGTEWPEYFKDSTKAKRMSRSTSLEVVDRVKARMNPHKIKVIAVDE